MTNENEPTPPDIIAELDESDRICLEATRFASNPEEFINASIVGDPIWNFIAHARTALPKRNQQLREMHMAFATLVNSRDEVTKSLSMIYSERDALEAERVLLKAELDQLRDERKENARLTAEVERLQLWKVLAGHLDDLCVAYRIKRHPSERTLGAIHELRAALRERSTSDAG